MRSPRAELVAETAITLLAERGMRGLTHRAVDEAARLPPGAASNVARTRTALLELALERLNELEERQFADVGTSRPPTDRAGAADLVARLLHAQITRDRRRTLARYELALEATRRPELRTMYDASGRHFREPAVALMAKLGSRDPVTDGRRLVVFAEGVMFYALAGAGTDTVPSLDDLRRDASDFLTALEPPTRDDPQDSRP
ncbi:TetR/AcrR family transcriptional regulator [Actinomadura algeriensis]|uniref:DNA-binding transcriptional regulator YbjK n=1 Tax=Actinomadura algeriensis TaxID=1679523 RepID=A0ABR9JPW6_9ACTN|nr:TetR/AcrR family transcriptional regulator [Actinomadura algeriensis]MBE1532443.1 DNA-binding transcriptional regulator YbjK [Actinomadura algeriensis]